MYAMAGVITSKCCRHRAPIREKQFLQSSHLSTTRSRLDRRHGRRVFARWAGGVALICADVLGLALVAPTLGAAARWALGHRVERSRQAGTPRVSALALVAIPPVILIVVGVCLAWELFVLLPI